MFLSNGLLTNGLDLVAVFRILNGSHSIYTYYGIKIILMILASNSCMPLCSIYCTAYYTGHFAISIIWMPPAATNSEPEVTESFQVLDGKVLLACSFYLLLSGVKRIYTLAQPGSLLLCPSSTKSNG